MSLFFNGRLIITPATVSKVDDSALQNRGLSVGNNVAYLGTSEGGQPNTPLSFGSPAEAKAVLRRGPLLDAVVKAFDPSAETGAPATVVAIRVNPATQSTLNLVNGVAATVIALASTDYGLWTRNIKVKVESATNKGKKLTSQVGNDYYSQDDVYRDAFSVQYTGAQVTATLDITGTSAVLSAPAGTPVATLDLTAYSTIQQLVDRINATTDFTATVLDGNGEQPALNGLDYVSAQDIKTGAYTATANLQAIVDWFNGAGEGFVTATRAPGQGTVPANIPFTYLTGGSDGVTTNTEWSNAYTTLQTVDVQWVTPLSSSSAIHAMNDAHCAYMSVIGAMERRSIVGGGTGISDDDAIAAAKLLNSDRTSLLHLGYYDYDDSGALVLRPAYMTAALVSAAFSGLNPGEALTNKSLKVRGWERKLRNPTDTDKLIKGGVMPVEDTARGYRVVKSISTWLNDSSYYRVEQSVGCALDFTVRNLRNAIDVLRGQGGSPQKLGRAVNIADSTLRELSRPQPSGPGVLVGDEVNPPYKNIRASLEGDVMRVDAQVSPVIPINYIPITIYAVPYTGSATI